MQSLPSKSRLLDWYETMLRLRQFELRAQELYRNGRIPGFIHLYVGEEAVGAGVCAHLNPADWITSTHRGHGHALAKGVPSRVVLAELYGKATGCCGGRGGSMHLYEKEAGLFGTNGFVGGGIPAAVGLGFSARARGTREVAVAFFGDGAVNHGTFHESINLAAVQNLPVLFVCENNLYATATPLKMATRNLDIASRGDSYGVPAVAVDGNDVVAVAAAAEAAVQRARAGDGPTLIEARTYRTVGHHEGDPLVGTYRTQEELDAWKKLCPIARLRSLLLEKAGATAAEIDARVKKVAAEIEEAVAFAEASPLPEASTAYDHVYAEPLHPEAPAASLARAQEAGWLDAVRDGIAEEMRRDPHIMYFGEGIGERGGTFAHTKNLWKEFGAARVVDTPICELGFTGAAIAASATGARTIADLMFADFIFEAASQIIEQAGKLRYMSQGKIGVPVVIRAGMGSIKNAGPHHSGAYYPIWAHCPGLLVAVPSNPADAKGLMKTALRAGDPVIFLEHKMLFSTKGPVPVSEYAIPFGQARLAREGKDLTLVACGFMVQRSVEAAARLEREGISCDVIDLRTIVPLDVDAIVQSISKTGRVLVVDEAFAMCGLGAEIAARIMEEAFDELDAPVGRLHTETVTFPFSPPLENEVVVTVDKIAAAARDLLKGIPPKPRRVRGIAGNKNSRAGAAVSGRPSATAAAASVPVPAGAGQVPIRLPNQDLTITEATILKWMKKPGDRVNRGEILLEAETAKAVITAEAPVGGTLRRIDVDPGKVAAMDETLGWIETDGGQS